MSPMARASVGMLFLAAAALACAVPISAPSPDPTALPSARPVGTADPKDTPATSAGTTPLPSETATPNFGPLAVYETENVAGYDGLTYGTLVLTPDCAFIEAEGDRAAIVWPYAPDFWRWDATTGEIVSLRFGEVTRELRFSSGDGVMLGGADLDRAVQDEKMRSMKWVVPPRDECITPTVFFSNGELSEWEPS